MSQCHSQNPVNVILTIHSMILLTNGMLNKVDFHANEQHSPNEWDPQTEGKIADPQERHKDKVLDKYCDDHPGSPMCKVFDE